MRFHVPFSLWSIIATGIALISFDNISGLENSRLIANVYGGRDAHVHAKDEAPSQNASSQKALRKVVRQQRSYDLSKTLQRRSTILLPRAERANSAPLPSLPGSPRVDSPARNHNHRPRRQQIARLQPQNPARQASPSPERSSARSPPNSARQASPPQRDPAQTPQNPAQQANRPPQTALALPSSPPRQGDAPQQAGTLPQASSGEQARSFGRDPQTDSPVQAPERRVVDFQQATARYQQASSSATIHREYRSPGKEEADRLRESKKGLVLDRARAFGGAVRKSPGSSPRTPSPGSSSPRAEGHPSLTIKTGKESSSGPTLPSPPVPPSPPPPTPPQPSSPPAAVAVAVAAALPAAAPISPPTNQVTQQQSRSSGSPGRDRPVGSNSPRQSTSQGLPAASLTNQPDSPRRPDSPTAIAIEEVKHIQKGKWAHHQKNPFEGHPTLTGEYTRALWDPSLSQAPALPPPVTNAESGSSRHGQISQPIARSRQPALWIGDRPEGPRSATEARLPAGRRMTPSPSAVITSAERRSTDQTNQISNTAKRADRTASTNNSPSNQNSSLATNRASAGTSPASNQRNMTPTPDTRLKPKISSPVTGQSDSRKRGPSDETTARNAPPPVENRLTSGLLREHEGIVESAARSFPPPIENRLTSGLLREHEKTIQETPELYRDPSISQANQGNPAARQEAARSSLPGKSPPGVKMKSSPKTIPMAAQHARNSVSSEGSPAQRLPAGFSTLNSPPGSRPPRLSSGDSQTSSDRARRIRNAQARIRRASQGTGSPTPEAGRLEGSNFRAVVEKTPSPTSSPQDAPRGGIAQLAIEAPRRDSLELPSGGRNVQAPPVSSTAIQPHRPGGPSFSFPQAPSSISNPRLMKYMYEHEIEASLRETAAQERAKKSSSSSSPGNRTRGPSEQKPSRGAGGSSSQSNHARENLAGAAQHAPTRLNSPVQQLGPPADPQRIPSAESELDFHAWREQYSSQSGTLRTVSRSSSSSPDTNVAVARASLVSPRRIGQSQIPQPQQQRSPTASSSPAPATLETGNAFGGTGGVAVNTSQDGQRKAKKTCALVATVLNCLYDWTGGEMPQRNNIPSEIDQNQNPKP